MLEVLNKEFRDVTAEASWPFSVSSSLELPSGAAVSPACFLDASVYPPGAIAPYEITLLNAGTTDGLLVEISDSTNKLVCHGILAPGTGYTILEDEDGAIAGSITHDPYEVEKLAASVGKVAVTPDPGALMFDPAVCWSPEAPGARFIRYSDGLETGDLSIVAAGGVHFEKEADGSVSINIYGELPTLKQPIVSVDGVSPERLWLAAWPAGAVRVATRGDRLFIGLEKDFGYGT